MSRILELTPQVTFANWKQKMDQWNGIHLKFFWRITSSINRQFALLSAMLPSLSGELLMVLPGAASCYFFPITSLVIFPLPFTSQQRNKTRLINVLTKVYFSHSALLHLQDSMHHIIYYIIDIRLPLLFPPDYGDLRGCCPLCILENSAWNAMHVGVHWEFVQASVCLSLY